MAPFRPSYHSEDGSSDPDLPERLTSLHKVRMDTSIPKLLVKISPQDAKLFKINNLGEVSLRKPGGAAGGGGFLSTTAAGGAGGHVFGGGSSNSPSKDRIAVVNISNTVASGEVLMSVKLAGMLELDEEDQVEVEVLKSATAAAKGRGSGISASSQAVGIGAPVQSSYKSPYDASAASPPSSTLFGGVRGDNLNDPLMKNASELRNMLHEALTSSPNGPSGTRNAVSSGASQSYSTKRLKHQSEQDSPSSDDGVLDFLQPGYIPRSATGTGLPRRSLDGGGETEDFPGFNSATASSRATRSPVAEPYIFPTTASRTFTSPSDDEDAEILQSNRQLLDSLRGPPGRSANGTTSASSSAFPPPPSLAGGGKTKQMPGSGSPPTASRTRPTSERVSPIKKVLSSLNRASDFLEERRTSSGGLYVGFEKGIHGGGGTDDNTIHSKKRELLEEANIPVFPWHQRNFTTTRSRTENSNTAATDYTTPRYSASTYDFIKAAASPQHQSGSSPEDGGGIPATASTSGTSAGRFANPFEPISVRKFGSSPVDNDRITAELETEANRQKLNSFRTTTHYNSNHPAVQSYNIGTVRGGAAGPTSSRAAEVRSEVESRLNKNSGYSSFLSSSSSTSFSSTARTPGDLPDPGKSGSSSSRGKAVFEAATAGKKNLKSEPSFSPTTSAPAAAPPTGSKSPRTSARTHDEIRFATEYATATERERSDNPATTRQRESKLLSDQMDPMDTIVQESQRRNRESLRRLQETNERIAKARMEMDGWINRDKTGSARPGAGAAEERSRTSNRGVRERVDVPTITVSPTTTTRAQHKVNLREMGIDLSSSSDEDANSEEEEEESKTSGSDGDEVRKKDSGYMGHINIHDDSYELSSKKLASDVENFLKSTSRNSASAGRASSLDAGEAVDHLEVVGGSSSSKASSSSSSQPVRDRGDTTGSKTTSSRQASKQPSACDERRACPVDGVKPNNHEPRRKDDPDTYAADGMATGGTSDEHEDAATNLFDLLRRLRSKEERDEREAGDVKEQSPKSVSPYEREAEMKRKEFSDLFGEEGGAAEEDQDSPKTDPDTAADFIAQFRARINERQEEIRKAEEEGRRKRNARGAAAGGASRFVPRSSEPDRQHTPKQDASSAGGKSQEGSGSDDEGASTANANGARRKEKVHNGYSRYTASSSRKKFYTAGSPSSRAGRYGSGRRDDSESPLVEDYDYPGFRPGRRSPLNTGASPSSGRRNYYKQSSSYRSGVKPKGQRTSPALNRSPTSPGCWRSFASRNKSARANTNNPFKAKPLSSRVNKTTGSLEHDHEEDDSTPNVIGDNYRVNEKQKSFDNDTSAEIDLNVSGDTNESFHIDGINLRNIGRGDSKKSKKSSKGGASPTAPSSEDDDSLISDGEGDAFAYLNQGLKDLREHLGMPESNKSSSSPTSGRKDRAEKADSRGAYDYRSRLRARLGEDRANSKAKTRWDYGSGSDINSTTSEDDSKDDQQHNQSALSEEPSPARRDFDFREFLDEQRSSSKEAEEREKRESVTLDGDAIKEAAAAAAPDSKRAEDVPTSGSSSSSTSPSASSSRTVSKSKSGSEREDNSNSCTTAATTGAASTASVDGFAGSTTAPSSTRKTSLMDPAMCQIVPARRSSVREPETAKKMKSLSLNLNEAENPVFLEYVSAKVERFGAETLGGASVSSASSLLVPRQWKPMRKDSRLMLDVSELGVHVTQEIAKWFTQDVSGRHVSYFLCDKAALLFTNSRMSSSAEGKKGVTGGPLGAVCGGHTDQAKILYKEIFSKSPKEAVRMAFSFFGFEDKKRRGDWSQYSVSEVSLAYRKACLRAHRSGGVETVRIQAMLEVIRAFAYREDLLAGNVPGLYTTKAESPVVDCTNSSSEKPEDDSASGKTPAESSTSSSDHAANGTGAAAASSASKPKSEAGPGASTSTKKKLDHFTDKTVSQELTRTADEVQKLAAGMDTNELEAVNKQFDEYILRQMRFKSEVIDEIARLHESAAYAILGVDINATNEEIKKAYRQTAMYCHPDKGGDKEDFQELNAAYEKIMQQREEKKKEYEDAFGGGEGGFDFGSVFGGGDKKASKKDEKAGAEGEDGDKKDENRKKKKKKAKKSEDGDEQKGDGADAEADESSSSEDDEENGEQKAKSDEANSLLTKVAKAAEEASKFANTAAEFAQQVAEAAKTAKKASEDASQDGLTKSIAHSAIVLTLTVVKAVRVVGYASLDAASHALQASKTQSASTPGCAAAAAGAMSAGFEALNAASSCAQATEEAAGELQQAVGADVCNSGKLSDAAAKAATAAGIAANSAIQAAIAAAEAAKQTGKIMQEEACKNGGSSKKTGDDGEDENAKADGKEGDEEKKDEDGTSKDGEKDEKESKTAGSSKDAASSPPEPEDTRDRRIVQRVNNHKLLQRLNAEILGYQSNIKQFLASNKKLIPTVVAEDKHHIFELITDYLVSARKRIAKLSTQLSYTEILNRMADIPLLTPMFLPNALAISVNPETRVLRMAAIFDTALLKRMLDVYLFDFLKREIFSKAFEERIDKVRKKVFNEIANIVSLGEMAEGGA